MKVGKKIVGKKQPDRSYIISETSSLGLDTSVVCSAYAKKMYCIFQVHHSGGIFDLPLSKKKKKTQLP